MKKKFRLTWNAPCTLIFTLLCALILVLDKYVADEKLIPAFFMVSSKANASGAGGFMWNNPIEYVRLFTHVFGHSDWNHFLSNFSFILLLGPLMEERYGSWIYLLMGCVTSFVTGVVNVCFMPTSLLGSSSIAFMLVILTSVSTLNKKEIPVSFIFLLAVFIALELISPNQKNISTVAHIVGGLCGSVFGFLIAPKTKRVPEKTENISSKPKKYVEKDSVPTKNYDDDKTVEVGTIKL